MSSIFLHVLSNLKELSEATTVGTTLSVPLLSKQLIKKVEFDLLNDERTPTVTRATKFYTDTVSTFDDGQFATYKQILKDIGNMRALQILNKFDGYKPGKNYCLIINVPNDRLGAEHDEAALIKTFKGCKFECIKVCTGFKKAEIIEALKEFQLLVRNASPGVGSVFIVLASHGTGYDYFVSSDGSELCVDSDVIDLFNGANSPELKSIPKVFLINFCRGDMVDCPRANQKDSVAFTSAKQHHIPSWGSGWSTTPSSTTEKDASPILPTYSDIFVAFASYQGFVANRDPSKGTWFFQGFCNAVQNFTKERPLCIKVIFDKVSEEMKSKETEAGEKQIPEYKNIGFSKSLYLQYQQ